MSISYADALFHISRILKIIIIKCKKSYFYTIANTNCRKISSLTFGSRLYDNQLPARLYEPARWEIKSNRMIRINYYLLILIDSQNFRGNKKWFWVQKTWFSLVILLNDLVLPRVHLRSDFIKVGNPDSLWLHVHFQSWTNYFNHNIEFRLTKFSTDFFNPCIFFNLKQFLWPASD